MERSKSYNVNVLIYSSILTVKRTDEVKRDFNFLIFYLYVEIFKCGQRPKLSTFPISSSWSIPSILVDFNWISLLSLMAGS